MIGLSGRLFWYIQSHKEEGRLQPLFFLLAPFAFCFSQIVKMRNFIYDREWKRPKKAPIPVVSIGNIVVGGTGKTPFALLLAKSIQPFGKVAILTRGYGASSRKGSHPLVVSTGEKPLYPSHIAGDEAYLMASSLPGIIVISGKNRYLAAIEAKKRGASLVLLDDGMQHRQLYRDIEIVLTEGNESREKFLPAGFLRDEPRRLSKADVLIGRGGIEISWRLEEPASLKGIKVGLFCGLARPDRFVAMVKNAGAEIVSLLLLADHEKISQKRLSSFADEAKEKGATQIICTQKDWVKVEEGPLSLPLTWIKRELVISHNIHKWEELISEIRGLLV